ncbi:hypothetical protein M885DRAFT_513166 [Pelagophyceae sp. CCMP2097]|nr:hypothetical protein M885DRAFT_513166 [Pelagophyceae sp. CCMP2097]
MRLFVAWCGLAAAWGFPPPKGHTNALRAPALLAVDGGPALGVEPSQAAAAERRALLGYAVDALPAAPSPQLVCFVWASNAALLAPLGIGAALCGLNVRGDKWAVDGASALLGTACAIPWLALSLLPLDKWFKSLEFMAEVTTHTELFTATLLGTRRGGKRRWAQVAAFSTLLSCSAGIFEELAFRGTAQRLLGLGLTKVFGHAPVCQGVSIVAVSTAFGALHNYVPGYAALAALAGAYFGAIYALSGNLFVAAVCHAVVDVVAFGACYNALLAATPEKRAMLASRDFPTTTTLRAWRLRFDQGTFPKAQDEEAPAEVAPPPPTLPIVKARVLT